MIWRIFVDCMCHSFRDARLSPPLHRSLLGRNCFGCRENKELVVGGRRAEERVEIDQDLRRERGGTRGMVDGQPGIIAENEWIGR